MHMVNKLMGRGGPPTSTPPKKTLSQPTGLTPTDTKVVLKQIAPPPDPTPTPPLPPDDGSSQGGHIDNDPDDDLYFQDHDDDNLTPDEPTTQEKFNRMSADSMPISPITKVPKDWFGVNTFRQLYTLPPIPIGPTAAFSLVRLFLDAVMGDVQKSVIGPIIYTLVQAVPSPIDEGTTLAKYLSAERSSAKVLQSPLLAALNKATPKDKLPDSRLSTELTAALTAFEQHGQFITKEVDKQTEINTTYSAFVDSLADEEPDTQLRCIGLYFLFFMRVGMKGSGAGATLYTAKLRETWTSCMSDHPIPAFPDFSTEEMERIRVSFSPSSASFKSVAYIMAAYDSSPDFHDDKDLWVGQKGWFDFCFLMPGRLYGFMVINLLAQASSALNVNPITLIKMISLSVFEKSMAAVMSLVSNKYVYLKAGDSEDPRKNLLWQFSRVLDDSFFPLMSGPENSNLAFVLRKVLNPTNDPQHTISNLVIRQPDSVVLPILDRIASTLIEYARDQLALEAEKEGTGMLAKRALNRMTDPKPILKRPVSRPQPSPGSPPANIIAPALSRSGSVSSLPTM